MTDPGDADLDSASYAYGFNGEPISVEEWGLLGRDPRGRVGNAHIGPVRIATDWIGVDTSGDQPPLIYEMMVFPRRNRDSNAEWKNMQWRYPTREAALAGHIRLVNRIRARGVGVLLDSRRHDDRNLMRILMGLLAELDKAIADGSPR